MSDSDSTTTVYDPTVLPERFRRFVVDDETGCWNWTGPITFGGYPCAIQYQYHKHAAHRLIYELYEGVVADHMHVHHECNNKCCVNPAHLRPLTRSDHRRTYVSLTPECISRLEALTDEG